jgi:hypothetical protein
MELGEEPQITLHGQDEHAGEAFTMTYNEWMGEAYLSQYELLELYGLDNLDILEGLLDEGYEVPGFEPEVQYSDDIDRHTEDPWGIPWEVEQEMLGNL